MRNKSAMSKRFVTLVRADPGIAFSVLVMAALVVMLLNALGRLTWTLLEPKFGDESPARAEPAVTAATGGRGYDIEALRGTHLFGIADTSQLVPAAHQDAPETELDLSLKGILFTEDPADSRAIIATGTAPDLIYGLGASLSGDATIEAMYRDRIVLERAGRLETLLLPDLTGTNSAGPAEGGAPKLTIDNRNDPAISSLLAATRLRFLTDPGVIARQIQLEPAESGEAMEGFRIRAGSEGPRLLEQLGLKAGDVITSVNGIDLNSGLRGVEAIRELAATQELAVSVRRKGNLIELRYSFGE